MEKIYDVAIVGSGVAGLSASICSASEGYSTVILESSNVFGGQAGTASLIENLIGFPKGISGLDLTKRSLQQAIKFGVKFNAPFKVIDLKREDDVFYLTSADKGLVKAKIVLLSTGMEYNKLEGVDLERSGIYYGSPSLFEVYKDETITVVGGANSAGQACVYLSGCLGCKVNLIVRAETFEKTMSHYLVEKIKSIDNIKVYTNAEVVEANKGKSLNRLTLNDGTVLETTKLFILIGSKPKTGWLDVPMDESGYIITDSDLRVSEGLFSAGDVRADSIKRVACALGEGGRILRGIRQDLEKINNRLTQ